MGLRCPKLHKSSFLALRIIYEPSRGKNVPSYMCAQRRIKSAYVSAQSEQSTVGAYKRNFISFAIQKAPSEDSDQIARMRRLIWIFAERACRKVHFPTLGLIHCFRCNAYAGPMPKYVLISHYALIWYLFNISVNIYIKLKVPYTRIMTKSTSDMYTIYPVSILYKSIAGRYRPVRVADGPITARYRFIKNASWVYVILFYSLWKMFIWTATKSSNLLIKQHRRPIQISPGDIVYAILFEKLRSS